MSIKSISLEFIRRENAVILMVNAEYLNGYISVMAEILQAILQAGNRFSEAQCHMF